MCLNDVRWSFFKFSCVCVDTGTCCSCTHVNWRSFLTPWQCLPKRLPQYQSCSEMVSKLFTCSKGSLTNSNSSFNLLIRLSALCGGVYWKESWNLWKRWWVCPFALGCYSLAFHRWDPRAGRWSSPSLRASRSWPNQMPIVTPMTCLIVSCPSVPCFHVLRSPSAQ